MLDSIRTVSCWEAAASRQEGRRSRTRHRSRRPPVRAGRRTRDPAAGPPRRRRHSGRGASGRGAVPCACCPRRTPARTIRYASTAAASMGSSMAALAARARSTRGKSSGSSNHSSSSRIAWLNATARRSVGRLNGRGGRRAALCTPRAAPPARRGHLRRERALRRRPSLPGSRPTSYCHPRGVAASPKYPPRRTLACRCVSLTGRAATARFSCRTARPTTLVWY
ncbi:MAG: hypothetical protein QOI20_2846 [Acidimicrobiaceae bacterium]|nr:hypothetical protein [Acidimicrobiaceae bacterium]